VGAALDYFECLGQMHRDSLPDVVSGGVADRRLNYQAALDAIGSYERELGAHLIEMLLGLPGVRIAGITDPARLNQRVPTVVFTKSGYTPRQIAEHLARQHIYVWNGNYYALEIMERLGQGAHGMVRIGPVHYNTHAEIEHLEAALRQLD
jgi:selenocysteine lyase/cysteine desulfurase